MRPANLVAVAATDFQKKGHPPITIPENEPIRLTYVKLVKAIIESERVVSERP